MALEPAMALAPALSSMPSEADGLPLKVHDAAVGIGLEHHLRELLGGVQAAARGHGRVQLLALQCRLAPQLTGRHVGVLRLQCGLDIRRHQCVLAHLFRVQPDTHGVFLADRLDVANTTDAADLVIDARFHEVGDIEVIEPLDLVMVRPFCCTACGSVAIAACSWF
ncbi:hypothetical protein G6F68_015500 [Rhizopus microsporus]|nr:hypothetical protein G6F68_015500 [Rhizopus microsporus]